MLHCYKCTRPKSIKSCGRCRKVLKFQMVKILLNQDPIYLSEQTRNKHGRPSTSITSKKKIKQIIESYQELHSYRKVAAKLNLKKHQVASVITTYYLHPLLSINKD